MNQQQQQHHHHQQQQQINSIKTIHRNKDTRQDIPYWLVSKTFGKDN